MDPVSQHHLSCVLRLSPLLRAAGAAAMSYHGEVLGASTVGIGIAVSQGAILTLT